ncbi:MAG: ThiF family adenylyltransferase [Bryobacteraceae bacterium]
MVAEILWPEPGEVISRPRQALTFSSGYMRRAHMLARKRGLAGIITFHTHPTAKNEVGFSIYDDRQDPLLMENLQELCPETLLSSVVLGEVSQQGRLWTSCADCTLLANLIAVGDRLRYEALDGMPPRPAPTPAEIFDRALAMTGSGALALLADMTIVVIGASGTGSLICELLARAGCRRIIVIDPDIVKLPNLNRILYATADDARLKRAKVGVLKRGMDGLGLGCEVIPIKGSVLDDTVLRKLNSADLIFGSVDKDYPRMLLCKYAYQHLVPYIDVGAEIGGDKEGIVSTDARVNYVAPGRWCLRCTGLVTARRLAFESLTSAERQRKVALGYSDGLLLKQPAVMDLNMRSASAGVMLLRHLLQRFLLEPLPVTLAENLVTYNMKALPEARAACNECDVCRVNPYAGYGDCGEQIGLESHVAASLLEPDE